MMPRESDISNALMGHEDFERIESFEPLTYRLGGELGGIAIEGGILILSGPPAFEASRVIEEFYPGTRTEVSPAAPKLPLEDSDADSRP